MSNPMAKRRVWFFRGLVAIAAALMVVSVIMPWWTCIIEHSQYGYQGTITIYQYGIPNAPLEIAGDITPLYQTLLALTYIMVSVGLMIWSTRLETRKGQLLLGGIGLSFIVYAAVAAFVVIAQRVADFGGVLQGYSEIRAVAYQEPVIITTSLRFGYYLAYAAGGMCLVLALLQNVILDRPRINQKG
jgi:hypothetical protein